MVKNAITRDFPVCGGFAGVLVISGELGGGGVYAKKLWKTKGGRTGTLRGKISHYALERRICNVIHVGT